MCRLILSFLFLFLSLSVQAQDTLRIACVGNSITEGYGLADKAADAYPTRLQQILNREAGAIYQVGNFGLSAHTLMRRTDRPYMTPYKTKHHPFREALRFQPHIVTIALGTNDSKTPYDSLLHADFVSDYCALIDSFAALPTHPQIYLCLPIPCVGEKWDIRDSVIVGEVIPRIRQVAEMRGLPVIDLYTPMKPFPELLPDQVHPNRAGAMLIAEEIARRLLLQR